MNENQAEIMRTLTTRNSVCAALAIWDGDPRCAVAVAVLFQQAFCGDWTLEASRCALAVIIQGLTSGRNRCVVGKGKDMLLHVALCSSPR